MRYGALTTPQTLRLIGALYWAAARATLSALRRGHHARS